MEAIYKIKNTEMIVSKRRYKEMQSFDKICAGRGLKSSLSFYVYMYFK